VHQRVGGGLTLLEGLSARVSHCMACESLDLHEWLLIKEATRVHSPVSDFRDVAPPCWEGWGLWLNLGEVEVEGVSMQCSFSTLTLATKVSLTNKNQMQLRSSTIFCMFRICIFIFSVF